MQKYGLIGVEDLNFNNTGMLGCGTHVPKTLADRWHKCTACGLSISRDLNAALNILKRSLALLATQGLGWSLQAITVDLYSSEQSRAVA